MVAERCRCSATASDGGATRSEPNRNFGRGEILYMGDRASACAPSVPPALQGGWGVGCLSLPRGGWPVVRTNNQQNLGVNPCISCYMGPRVLWITTRGVRCVRANSLCVVEGCEAGDYVRLCLHIPQLPPLPIASHCTASAQSAASRV